DAYVLCLTDTVERETELSPLELYERLRGGAVRGGVISIPGRALVSASPERFLSVRDGTVSTHPIKGTRPRGQSPEQDSALAAELAADPKERAENLMIVDLMRNDLARVCEVGSVRVERFLAVETHPRVHQLVSTVAGELRADLDVCDAIAACFPGGSMTGAPKRSAVEILAGLEAGPRGLYSGCFGWIDDSGDAELAMTIRGIELRREPSDGGAWGDGATARAFVGAGGGITIDSDPVAERRERDLKAAAMLAIL
uniref:anthranilate synthase component I family protein n=1 Tax=Leucobacter sp. BZR 635 TaxID=3378705 RepID=UPI003A85DEEF